MVEPIVKGMAIADLAFIQALKNFNEEILNILYDSSNDIIQEMLIEEICRLKGFSLENKIVA